MLYIIYKDMKQHKRLNKPDRFKETLTRALVHDLKNPLSQILHNNRDQSVKYPAMKMLRLITNMLDVEKYEDTEFKLNKKIHSLRIMLEDVKTGQEPALREKNLELHFHFAGYEILADKEEERLNTELEHHRDRCSYPFHARFR